MSEKPPENTGALGIEELERRIAALHEQRATNDGQYGPGNFASIEVDRQIAIF